MNWGFHPEALEEYQQAALFYEERRRGLGTKLSQGTGRAGGAACSDGYCPERVETISRKRLSPRLWSSRNAPLVFRISR